jgi:hypothetical protein
MDQEKVKEQQKDLINLINSITVEAMHIPRGSLHQRMSWGHVDINNNILKILRDVKLGLQILEDYAEGER